MHQFSTAVTIAAPIEEVYAFHRVTKNLKSISTPEVAVVILKQETSFEGEVLTLSLRWRGFVRSKWVVRIDTSDRPNTLVDVQVKGPFKAFRHARNFRSLSPTETELTDEVSYTMPFGILGTIMERLVVNRVFARQFAFRHVRTKQILELARAANDA